MATTDETKVDPGASPPGSEDSSGMRALKRYGPIAAVVVLLVGAFLIFGGGGDDDDGDDAAIETDRDATEDELILSGPMTPQRAELEGETDVDFGPTCDTSTGRIMMPSEGDP